MSVVNMQPGPLTTAFYFNIPRILIKTGTVGLFLEMV